MYGCHYETSQIRLSTTLSDGHWSKPEMCWEILPWTKVLDWQTSPPLQPLKWLKKPKPLIYVMLPSLHSSPCKWKSILCAVLCGALTWHGAGGLCEPTRLVLCGAVQGCGLNLAQVCWAGHLMQSLSDQLPGLFTHHCCLEDRLRLDEDLEWHPRNALRKVTGSVGVVVEWLRICECQLLSEIFISFVAAST